MGGPLEFSTLMLRQGVNWDGTFFHEGAGFYPGLTRYVRPPESTSLLTANRTHVVQRTWSGGNAPVDLDPLSATFEFLLTRESDYFRFEEAHGRADLHQLWVDFWFSDSWFIAGGATGQILWRTSRRLPYDGKIAGVDIAGDRKPQAFLETLDGDGRPVKVAQTLAASPPSAGEVFVPDVFAFGDVETPASLTERWLVLRYPPVFLVRVQGLRVAYDPNSRNALRVSVDLEEALGGDYTVATP